MFRRLIVAVALTGASCAVSPSMAWAESAGGTTNATQTAMGQIASGDRSTCAVNSGGLICWGNNGSGQLGTGDNAKRTIATSVAGLSGVTAVAMSAGNTCVIVTGGNLKCWGYNDYGQLGDGTTTTSYTPVDVCAVGGCGNGLMSGVTGISMSVGTVCAIQSDATVACWGYNNVYQIGRFTPYYSTTPLTVTGVTSVTALVSGKFHTCALISGGTMKCWGEGQYGQLGDGGSSKSTPVSVNRSGVTGVTAIAATDNATCAIVAASKVKCWGGDDANELGYDTGNPSPRSYTSSPTLISPVAVQTPVTPQLGGVDLTAKAIEGGPTGVCIIATDDRLACWGSIADMGIPSGGINFGSAFTSNWVSGMTSTTNVAVGTSTVCATNASALKCWGAAPFGELGNGTAGGSSMTSAVNVTVPTAQTATVAAIGNKTTASAATTLSGSSTSGQTLGYTTSTPAVCSVTNVGGTWTVTPVSGGTCTVTGTADGGSYLGTYYNVASATISFTVTAIAPVVTLNAATSITVSAASISASVNPALLNTTNVLKYSTSSSLTGATSVSLSSVSSNAGDTSISASLTGLSSGTTYYYTVESTNSVGTTTAPVQSFATLGFAPTVVTGSPTSVSSGRATLNAVVTPGGVATSIWFMIGQKSDLSDGTKIDYRELSDLTPVDVSVTATNLTESVRYYYRVEASNFKGSVKGDTKSFTAARPIGITINDAAEFTNKKAVTIYATGPSGSTQVIISNDGGFGSSQTFSLTDSYAEVPWTLVASRDERLPKTVYARFVQRFGTQSSTNTDDIILDTTAPTMTSASGASTSTSTDNVTVQSVRVTAAKGAVKLTVRASDKNSGIGKVQVKGSSGGTPVDVATGSPKATSRTVKVNTTKTKLWVRVVDRAGNVSKWVTVTVK